MKQLSNDKLLAWTVCKDTLKKLEADKTALILDSERNITDAESALKLASINYHIDVIKKQIKSLEK